MNDANQEPDVLKARIKELNDKSTQLLLFLSFAIVGAATLNSCDHAQNSTLIRSAIWWWMYAVFPVLFVVAPVKDIRQSKVRHGFIRWAKVWLLLLAIVESGIGAFQLLRAVSS